MDKVGRRRGDTQGAAGSGEPLGISGHRPQREISVSLGISCLLRSGPWLFAPAGSGLRFICQENGSSGERTHFPENCCPSEGYSTDTTFQSG